MTETMKGTRARVVYTIDRWNGEQALRVVLVLGQAFQNIALRVELEGEDSMGHRAWHPVTIEPWMGYGGPVGPTLDQQFSALRARVAVLEKMVAVALARLGGTLGESRASAEVLGSPLSTFTALWECLAHNEGRRDVWLESKIEHDQAHRTEQLALAGDRGAVVRVIGALRKYREASRVLLAARFPDPSPTAKTGVGAAAATQFEYAVADAEGDVSEDS